MYNTKHTCTIANKCYWTSIFTTKNTDIFETTFSNHFSSTFIYNLKKQPHVLNNVAMRMHAKCLIGIIKMWYAVYSKPFAWTAKYWQRLLVGLKWINILSPDDSSISMLQITLDVRFRKPSVYDNTAL